MGNTSDDLCIKGDEVAWGSLWGFGKVRLDNGLGYDEGVLTKEADRCPRQEQSGEGVAYCHLEQFDAASLRTNAGMSEQNGHQRNTFIPAGSGMGCAEATIMALNLAMEDG